MPRKQPNAFIIQYKRSANLLGAYFLMLLLLLILFRILFNND